MDYRKWLSDNDVDDPMYFGEDPTSLTLTAEALERPWDSAVKIVAALDSARNMQDDLPSVQKLMNHLETTEYDTTSHS